MADLLIDHISMQYTRKRWALQDISLHLKKGVIGIVGPNGSGKTTLHRILATQLAPTKGTITWNGADIFRNPRTLRRELGYLPQGFGFYPQLTAVEFLRYIGELKGLRGALLRQRVDTYLEMVRLTGDATRRLKSFSGGMIQRVGIAQALLNEPSLLLLDEPTVGVDPAERIHFREIIASLQGDRIILLSTHIITDIEAMANQVVLLKSGQICWAGTTSTLLADTAHAVWSLHISNAEFEAVRTSFQISSVITQEEHMEVRLISDTCPHPQAVAVTPSLEEAYLFFIGDHRERSHTLPVV